MARQSAAVFHRARLASFNANSLADAGEDVARAIYGDATYERLRSLKRAWDPDNVFRLNQNIRPQPAA